FASATEAADVMLLCGDLTDYGSVEEAKVLAKEITTSLRIPAIGVLGNHDYESDSEAEIVRILTDAGVTMLDGDSYELHGVGFAGVKGFGGGFGRRALGAWGEKMIKSFVHEAIEESLKLEAALARLRTPQKIGVLHYSPIQATVEGEPLEIVAFPTARVMICAALGKSTLDMSGEYVVLFLLMLESVKFDFKILRDLIG